MGKWLWILLFPLVAQAAGEGTWQASSIGVTLSNRGVAMSSRPLSPTEPVSGLMTLVVWNYTLIGPTPARRACCRTFALYLGSAGRRTPDPCAESST